MRSGTWFSGKRNGLGIQFNLGQEGVSRTTYGIDSMLQAAGLDEELMALLDNGKLIIASPAQAAQMQNDADLLKYAKAIANNDLEAIRGHYVIWIIGDHEWRGEIIGACERRVEFGEKGEQLDVTNLLDSTSHVVVIAPTEEEAEARLAMMQSATRPE